MGVIVPNLKACAKLVHILSPTYRAVPAGHVLIRADSALLRCFICSPVIMIPVLYFFRTKYAVLSPGK